MSHADLLKQLLPAAYDSTGVHLCADIAAHGKRLDDFQALASTLAAELDPRATTILLPDWERAYGLPGLSLMDAVTIDQRRAALVARINETGGLSKPYFTSILVAAGYEAVIDQPREFQAGVGRAGDRVYAPGACVWYFRVRLRRGGLVVDAANKDRVRRWLLQVKPAYSFYTIED
jgi:uncharacterized protein YmfQ (DUF2313 family)